MFKEFGFIEALPYLCIALGAVLAKGVGALADAKAAGVLPTGSEPAKNGNRSAIETREGEIRVMDRRAAAGEALLRKPVPPQRIEASRSRDGDGDDFTTSLVVAAATHSTLAGALAGGSLAGAVVGEALAEERDHRDDPSDSCRGADDRDSWDERGDSDACVGNGVNSDWSSDD
ncbi:hypothetical protein RKE25_22585 (plasmid) [Dyella sp. BiH032]|uniref:hypothetical protein n=1 Tax=Dyella sp. BiH032 TaxID=3075430 RepID=UPI002892AD02|nr:hypothetical protein [Dyella sp. BiH032]WNL48521.1 hypothetical protein RKE25_22585 [Dyella sp. BiH032]